MAAAQYRRARVSRRCGPDGKGMDRAGGGRASGFRPTTDGPGVCTRRSHAVGRPRPGRGLGPVSRRPCVASAAASGGRAATTRGAEDPAEVEVKPAAQAGLVRHGASPSFPAFPAFRLMCRHLSQIHEIRANYGIFNVRSVMNRFGNYGKRRGWSTWTVWRRRSHRRFGGCDLRPVPRRRIDRGGFRFHEASPPASGRPRHSKPRRSRRSRVGTGAGPRVRDRKRGESRTRGRGVRPILGAVVTT